MSDDDNNVFDFTSYREGTGNLVPCKRCKRPIPADSTQCMHCGLHYKGHAHQFVPAAEDGQVRMRSKWVRAFAVLILVFLVGFILLAIVAALA